MTEPKPSLKAVIIDDEREARRNLRSMLAQYCPQCQVLGEADSAETGAELLIRLQPDVVFLDILMKDGSGFDLLNRLEMRHSEVIFVTAYDAHAVRAFRYNALDYLLKPIDPAELTAAVTRCHERRGMTPPDVPAHARKLALTNSDGIYFIKASDIIRLEAFKNYTTFHLVDEQRITTSKNLGEYVAKLTSAGFFRCHQSHHINLAHVFQWKKDEGNQIIMTDGSSVPLARRKKEDFLQAMLQADSTGREGTAWNLAKQGNASAPK